VVHRHGRHEVFSGTSSTPIAITTHAADASLLVSAIRDLQAFAECLNDLVAAHQPAKSTGLCQSCGHPAPCTVERTIRRYLGPVADRVVAGVAEDGTPVRRGSDNVITQRDQRSRGTGP
jgi:hypothetical protein